MADNHSSGTRWALRLRNMAWLVLLLLPVSALGTRFELWPYTLGLMLFAISMLGSLLLQIVNAIWLMRKPSAEIKSALRLASLIALPPLLVVAGILRSSTDGAVIHDVSTDLINPPQFVAGISERGPGSNSLEVKPEVTETQRQAYPQLKPIISTLPPEQAFTKASDVAQSLGWHIYSQQAQLGIIEAVETTLWFGFKDDIVIRITPAHKGSKIDLRSVSRVGEGDLGANARRIDRFVESFTNP